MEGQIGNYHISRVINSRFLVTFIQKILHSVPNSSRNNKKAQRKGIIDNFIYNSYILVLLNSLLFFIHCLRNSRKS